MSRLLALGALLSLLAGCSQDQHRTSEPPQTTTPKTNMSAIPEFQSSRAFNLLTKQTAFGPRNPGSQAHQDCLQFFLSSLRPLADNVRTQEFIHDGYDGEKFHLTNVIASFKPDAAFRILLCAHWDSRPRAEHDENPTRRREPILGANDGASGVAVLMEIARLLKNTPPPVGVDIVLFDGEDYGREGDIERYLLGSRYFAKTNPPGYRPQFGILLDMVGDANLELPKEQNSIHYAPDIVNLVWNTARELGVTQFSSTEGDEILDDHIPLNEAGIKTIDIIDFNYPDASNRYWHTHNDTPEHCSAESLGAVGTVLTYVIYRTSQ